jgi:hypothetical protein
VIGIDAGESIICKFTNRNKPPEKPEMPEEPELPETGHLQRGLRKSRR